jgi:hypothetical protein
MVQRGAGPEGDIGEFNVVARRKARHDALECGSGDHRVV